MDRTIFTVWILLGTLGCSSLGINTYPTGNLLTDQTESLLDRAPRRVMLPRELDQTVLPAHYLQPGDVLIVEPVQLDSEVRFPADQRVMADGTIDLSGFGRVIVAGLTLEAAETLIEQTIVDAGAERTQVNVRLLEPVHRYYVLGDVASPGSYPLVGNETVLDGILAAGGLTSQANPCKVLLARPTPPSSCRVALPICYREITQIGDTTTNYQLQPGDRIFVASRTWLDELRFWRANQTCDRCCACQHPCPDPHVADFTNPMSRFLPGPPALPQRTGTEAPETVSTPGATIDAGLVEEPSAAEVPDAETFQLPSIRRTPLPNPSSRDTPPARQPGELNFDSPRASEPVP